MSKLAIWLNSVGIQGHKNKKTVKKGQIRSFLANFDLVLLLKFWMPTDFNNLAYFGITNVQMNGKCWNRGVTFSLRTIFHFEQCALEFTSSIVSILKINRFKSYFLAISQVPLWVECWISQNGSFNSSWMVIYDDEPLEWQCLVQSQN